MVQTDEHKAKKSFLSLLIMPFILLALSVGCFFLYVYGFSLGTNRALFSNVSFVLLTLAFMKLIYNIFVYILHKYKRTANPNSMRPILFNIFKKIVRAIFVVIAINVIILFIPLPSFYQDLATKLVYGILISLVGWFLLQIVSLGERGYYLSSSAHNKLGFVPKSQITKIKIIKQIINAVIVVCTISAILMLFHTVRNLGISLLASAGFITAIIGFAIQKPLSSIFTNFQIAFTQPIKIDDVVIIENEYGTIEEITMSYAVIKLWDSRRMIVPTNYFVEKPFQNWSYKPTNLQGTVVFYLNYKTPIEQFRQEFEEQIKHISSWDKKIAKVQVSDLKQNCIELKLVISAATPDNLGELRIELREKMLSFLQAHADYLPA